MASKKRFTIEFTPELLATIEKISKQDGVPKAAVIKKALSLYTYLFDEVFNKENRGLTITEKKGNEKREIIELVLT